MSILDLIALTPLGLHDVRNFEGWELYHGGCRAFGWDQDMARPGVLGTCHPLLLAVEASKAVSAQ